MERDAQVLMERVGGAKLKDVAARHSLSIEGVRIVAAREGRKHVDQIVLQAWACQKTGDLLTLAVPAWAEQDLATEYLAWIAGELKRRDDGIWRVHYRPALDGSFVFAIEDISFNPKVAS